MKNIKKTSSSTALLKKGIFNERFKEILKISLPALLIYLKFIFYQIDNPNNNYLNLISNIFLIVSGIVLTLIGLNDNLLKKIVKKHNTKIKALTIFTSYFVYQEIFVTIILGIIAIFGISNLGPTISQIIYISITILYILFIIKLNKNFVIECFKKIKNNYRFYLETGIPLYLFGLILMILFNFLFQFVFKMEGPKNENEIDSLLKIMPVYVAFAASIGAPIIEEFIFRKTLKDIISNKKLFIILSGFIFGALHVIGSYTNISDLLYILPYGALGFVFAYIYTKTENILVPVSLHLVHNTTLIIIQFMVMK